MEERNVVLELFVSPTCPNCPPAKKLVADLAREDKSIKVVEYNTYTTKGQRRAKSFDVMSVPTIFVRASHSEERLGFKGMPVKDRLIKAINITKGIEKEEIIEKKSIVSKFKGIFS